MNTTLLSTIVAALTLSLGACVSPDNTSATFRAGDSFWADVVCVSGVFGCWALHPGTDDAWASVHTWGQIEDLVEAGRLIPDLTSGYGAQSCAPGETPEMFPTFECYRIKGTKRSLCYGGGDTWAAEVRPHCDPNNAGYTLSHYVVAGCTADLGDHDPILELFGHTTHMEQGLLRAGNDTVEVSPQCHFLP